MAQCPWAYLLSLLMFPNCFPPEKRGIVYTYFCGQTFNELPQHARQCGPDTLFRLQGAQVKAGTAVEGQKEFQVSVQG